jgi:hypothetical protein
MRDTLETINQMQIDGVIDKYAIGGAVGATFYLEPSATEDVDIFVMLPTVSGRSLLLHFSPPRARPMATPAANLDELELGKVALISLRVECHEPVRLG